MLDALAFEHLAEQLGLLNGNGTHQNRLAFLMGRDDIVDYSGKFTFFRTENSVRHIFTDHGLIGGHLHNRQVIDRPELIFLGLGGARHARQLVIHPEEILEEVKVLVSKGFREVVLTGINTALYGTEEHFPYPLTEEEAAQNMFGIEVIISRLNALEGEFRIRLSSLEPTVVNADYVRRLMRYEKLCPHLHLSIQSGSDHVLTEMNRHYSRQDYLDIIKVLKEYDPHYGVTTDIICGFPGETEEDFEDSLRMTEAAGFLKVHAFKFSKREGTAAFEMKDQIDGETKNDRVRRLIEKAETITEEFLKSSAGEIRRVLFEQEEESDTGETGCSQSVRYVGERITDERKSQDEKNLLSGYSENYIKVYAWGSRDDLNCFRQVKLMEVYQEGMKGEIV